MYVPSLCQLMLPACCFIETFHWNQKTDQLETTASFQFAYCGRRAVSVHLFGLGRQSLNLQRELNVFLLLHIDHSFIHSFTRSMIHMKRRIHTT